MYRSLSYRVLPMTESVVARREIGGKVYEVDTAKDRLDIAVIHDFLSRRSRWAQGIARDVLDRAIANSLCFGLYRDGAQIGFARLVTDNATFAYVADVFVVAEARNNGLGQFLVETIVCYAPLQGLRRWLLVTTDAASLYRRCGFAELQPGFSYLERFDRDSYRKAAPS
jgi:GNAT superfamily N-acetyltransferase